LAREISRFSGFSNYRVVPAKQVENGTNTYQELTDFYEAADGIPVNINRTPFIRSLDTLLADIEALVGGSFV
jgi:hypothetical protein